MKQHLEVDRLASEVDGGSLGSIHTLVFRSRFSGSFIPNGEGNGIRVDPGQTPRLSGSELIFLQFISLWHQGGRKVSNPTYRSRYGF